MSRSQKKVTLRYETFEDFLAAAKVVPPAQDSASSRSTTMKADWAGTDTFAQAVETATRGWPEGASKALAMRASIDSAVREIICARKSSFAYDVVGDCVEVGRYLTGEPECFVTQVESGEVASGRVVKLVANLAASGAVSTKSLFARGATILAAIDILEAVGTRVELYISHGSRGSHCGVFQQFTLIKKADQPVDADRLAFCLCHAACLRRLSFSLMEQHGHLPNQTYPNGVTFDEDAIVTPEAYRGYDFTPQELLAAVADLCRQCGVEIPVAEVEALVSSH